MHFRVASSGVTINPEGGSCFIVPIKSFKIFLACSVFIN